MNQVPTFETQHTDAQCKANMVYGSVTKFIIAWSN